MSTKDEERKKPKVRTKHSALVAVLVAVVAVSFVAAIGLNSALPTGTKNASGSEQDNSAPSHTGIRALYAYNNTGCVNKIGGPAIC